MHGNITAEEALALLQKMVVAEAIKKAKEQVATEQSQ